MCIGYSDLTRTAFSLLRLDVDLTRSRCVNMDSIRSPIWVGWLVWTFYGPDRQGYKGGIAPLDPRDSGPTTPIHMDGHRDPAHWSLRSES